MKDLLLLTNSRCYPSIDFNLEYFTFYHISSCDWHDKFNDNSNVINKCRDVAYYGALNNVFSSILSKLIDVSTFVDKEEILNKRNILCSTEYIDTLEPVSVNINNDFIVGNNRYISTYLLDKNYNNFLIGFNYEDIAIMEESLNVKRVDNKITCDSKYLLQIKNKVYKNLP